MVDGSEGGQTIPLWGQIQPARASNFIIAWEDTNDAPPYGWNNGTNIYHTYQQASAAGLPFPIVPPFSTFIHQKWFERPVFFGCDKRLTTTGDSRSPIVLYLAHAPYSAYLNFTADQGVMSPQQMDDIFLNGFNQLTQGNGTLDPNGRFVSVVLLLREAWRRREWIRRSSVLDASRSTVGMEMLWMKKRWVL
jgi:lysophospholipase